MMNKLPVSIIVLTYNEEKNLERCLQSVHGWVDSIIIIDSGSTDKTPVMAKQYTEKIYHHPFENYAKQYNWALGNVPINTEWIIRLDADERITAQLREELLKTIPKLDSDVSGLYVKRKVYFMGKWIKHGGYYPIWLLRIWRKGLGLCEDRWMDEHIKITSGRAIFLNNDIIEENLHGLTWWTNKHNRYATREAIDMLNIKYHFFENNGIPARLYGSQEQKKRWLKERIYAKSPLFLRTFFYFIYRYFLQLGFLDGGKGLVWHFLQGFWYRFLVDAKIYEIENTLKEGKKSAKEIIHDMYGYEATK